MLIPPQLTDSILHLKVTHSFSSLLIDKNFSILGVRRDESDNKIHNSHLLRVNLV
jgi:hypothetical protein